MSLSATSTKVIYTANGTQTAWDFTFPAILAADLQVTTTDLSGVETILTSNYSVDIANGRVTYPTAVSGLAALTSGYKITLKRIEPLTQSLVLQNSAPFNAADVMGALDKLTMIGQQLQEQLDRAPKQAESTATVLNLIIPAPENGKYLGWSSGILANLDSGSFAAGTLGTQSASAVAITGGTITGITDLAISDGGTGQSTAQLAINALTDVASTTAGYVLTKVGANATWAAVVGGTFTTVSTTDYLTVPTHLLVIGSTTAITSAFVSIDGNADLKQLVVQGFSTQTNNILECQKSDGTVAFAVSNTAGVTVGGTTSQIKDSSGNELIRFTVTAAAVNEVTIKNNATTANPRISASGETNVGLELSGKGTRGVMHANAAWDAEVTLTDGATPALNASLGNCFYLDAAGNRTIAVPSNPPTSGYTQKIIIVHYANGGARTLALNTGAGGFRFNADITALTATSSGKKDYIGCKWNPIDSFWDVIGYTKGA